ncbi:MAG TPA: PhoU domain-containing protein [Longimicrobiales bacterium]|nr:PhoU domain-containing protein [Longimicrobiales bacterium]
MVGFKFLRGEGSERIDRIEAKVQAMLDHVREEFEKSMAALLGDLPPEEASRLIRGTDRAVNELEREIRRELVVHASVFGGIDTPAVLVYMSIVKDIERIGDYAKNLVDLALDGGHFSDVEDADEWRRLTAELSQLIADAQVAFRTRDSQYARRLFLQGERLLHQFDRYVSALVRGEDTGPQAVTRALAHRYLKRVAAHIMNLLSAVFLPVDRLDFFDEDPEDRTG